METKRVVKFVDENMKGLEDIDAGDPVAVKEPRNTKAEKALDYVKPIMTEAQLDAVIEAARVESASAPRPRTTIDVAVERHANLTRDIEAFCSRVASWVVPAEWEPLRATAATLGKTWADLGLRLLAAKVAKLPVKSTAKSRLRSWLKPGVHVELRPDIDEEFGAVYSREELDALEVVGVTETKVLLRTPTREMGMVPLAHVRKTVAGVADV